MSHAALKRYEQAIIRPHDASERSDPDFPTMMRCGLCGKMGMAPRSQVSEAMRWHYESDCSARAKAEEAHVTRIVFPWA